MFRTPQLYAIILSIAAFIVSGCQSSTTRGALPPAAIGSARSQPQTELPRTLRGYGVESRALFLESHPNDLRDREILRYLSSRLGSHERAVMYAALEELPRGYRRNVVYFSGDGLIYATDPSLKVGAIYTLSGSANVSEPMPMFTQAPYHDGYYHKHPSHAGSSFVQATVNDDCRDSFLALPAQENGYIQEGGATYRKAGGEFFNVSSVDAGLAMFSTVGGQVNEIETYMHDSYQGGGPTGQLEHWACDQALYMQFWAASPTELVLAITGKPINKPNGKYVAMLAVSSAELWKPQCHTNAGPSTCTVKFDTALSKPKFRKFPDGSYIGVSNHGNSNHAPKIFWRDVQTGHVRPDGTCGDCFYLASTNFLSCGGEPFHSSNVLVSPPPPSYPHNRESAAIVGLDASLGTLRDTCTPFGKQDPGQPPP